MRGPGVSNSTISPPSLTILISPMPGTFIGHLDHMVRPVLYATLLLDRTLYGTNPTGYHLSNLLHLGSGMLIYFILTRVVTEKTRQVPFWTALLFLIHPIHTETVTYVSGRASGLMSFLYLLALLFYIKASEAHAMRGLYRSGAIVAFVLSIGAEGNGHHLSFCASALGSACPSSERRRVTPSGDSPTASPVLGRATAYCGMGVGHPRYFILAHVSYTLRPLVDNGLSEAHAAIYALWLFFCPWNQNFDHDLPEFHSMGQWPPLSTFSLSGH